MHQQPHEAHPIQLDHSRHLLHTVCPLGSVQPDHDLLFAVQKKRAKQIENEPIHAAFDHSRSHDHLFDDTTRDWLEAECLLDGGQLWLQVFPVLEAYRQLSGILHHHFTLY